MGGSDISLIQNFPYISIGLQHVQFYRSKQLNERPIYEVERMYVGFSLPDILKQKYRVKAIVLKNGHLDLLQDAQGRLNIAEAARFTSDTTTRTDTASSQQMDLDVKKIILKNLDVSYQDKAGNQGQMIRSHIDKIKASCRMDNAVIDADLDGALLVDYIRPGDTSLFRNKHLSTTLQLSYNLSSQTLKLPVGKLKVEDAVFNITGTADLKHDCDVDIRIHGDKPDFKQLFSFAPAEVAKELKHFKYDGRLSFDGAIKGKLKGSGQPLIQLSFTCANAWLHNTQANKKLDSLSFKGYYTNGNEHSLRTSELRLTDMTARPGKGIFTGDFVLRDFSDPKILMQIHSDLQLEFIGAFLGIKDLQRITGRIILNMNFKELVDLSMPEKAMGKLTQGIQSELAVQNLTFRVPAYPYIIEHLNLHADMKNGFVKLDSLSCNVANSDFHLSGSISDLPALFHHQDRPVQVTARAYSKRMVMKELLAFDTARSNRAKEEIYGFNIGASLETSVDELRHPKPLPKGKLRIDSLFAAFKNYPHAFHDFGAELTIEDTTLRLKNFAGRIDSSDIHFSGRVNNYALWFEKIKKGKTQLAFDFKSQRLAMRDLLGRKSRQYVPKDYHQEVGAGIWLRSKIDLKYDTAFRFANIKVANISGQLKQHAIRLDSISGNVKFGVDHFIRIDTLKGKIGNSDFNLSMRLYTGKDTVRRKKENYLQFASNFLDADQLTGYKLTEDDTTPATTAAIASSGPAIPVESPSPGASVARSAANTSHNNGFNIFQIPFIDFNASINIGKIKYHRLWPKNLLTTIRMQANQQLYLDTFHIDIAGGKIGARAHFNGTNPDKIYLRSRIHVDNVNIEKMMLKLDYFGQDYVINKNIKGTLSGQIKSYVQVHPDLTPLIDQSQAQLDVGIRNGVLVDFAPMQAMSSYFKDKNLRMVRFDTLHNVLTFKNGALTIPAMNINSSLGFMEISGTQSLDTKMEYYIRIPLKMVTQAGWRMLFGKKQEEVNPDQVDAIEYRDKDKRVHFINLAITGTPDDYKVRLGRSKKS